MKTWVYRQAVMEVLGGGRTAFESVVSSGCIRSRRLPGMRKHQFVLEDELQVVAEAEGGELRPLEAAAVANPLPVPGGGAGA
jgi:hypothetical protein